MTTKQADDGSAHINSNNSTSNELHDLFSVAEIESALHSFKPSSINSDESSFGIRLPYLLRCLSALQSRSDISYFDESEVQDLNPNVSVIARLLEDVASAYQGAENVELLLALAPSLCRPVGKLPQLSRSTQDASRLMYITGGNEGSHSSWDTKGLNVALDRLSSFNDVNSKRFIKEKQASEKRQKLNDDSSYDSYNECLLLQPQSSDGIVTDTNMTETGSDSQHVSFASNDTYESALKRTLQELVSLVKLSLDSGRVGNNGEDDNPMAGNDSFYNETDLLNPGLSIKSESLFAETNPNSSSFGGEFSSLSVMVIILMHHTPILRYDHVASALCRATVPQAPALIKHMAANCAAAIPCLLRGMVDAYKLADKYRRSKPITSNNLSDDKESLGDVSGIIRTTADSIKSIATLSQSETWNVIHTLRKNNAMDEVVLELMIGLDPVAGASFIVEKLTTDYIPDGRRSKSKRNSFRRSSSSFNDQKRPIPLRGRMIFSRQQTDYVAPSLQIKHCLGESNLFSILKGDPQTTELCLQRISKRLSSSQSSHKSLGETALFMRAFALLIHCTSTCSIESVNLILCHLNLAGKTKVDLPKSASDDDIYKIAVSVMFIAWSKVMVSENPENEDSDQARVYHENLKRLLVGPKSLECVIFSSRLSGFIISCDENSLRSTILDFIYTCKYPIEGRSQETIQLSNAIKSILSTLGIELLENVHKSALTLNTTIYNPIVALDVIKRTGASPSKELDDLLKNLLSDPQSCSSLMRHPMACELIQESVKMLIRRAAPHIPIVLPVSAP